MENDLMKALKDANSQLSEVISSGKTADIQNHPAFTKLNDAMSKFKRALDSVNTGCVNTACAAPSIDKLGKVGNPGE